MCTKTRSLWKRKKDKLIVDTFEVSLLYSREFHTLDRQLISVACRSLNWTDLGGGHPDTAPVDIVVFSPLLFYRESLLFSMFNSSKFTEITIAQSVPVAANTKRCNCMCACGKMHFIIFAQWTAICQFKYMFVWRSLRSSNFPIHRMHSRRIMQSIDYLLFLKMNINR